MRKNIHGQNLLLRMQRQSLCLLERKYARFAENLILRDLCIVGNVVSNFQIPERLIRKFVPDVTAQTILRRNTATSVV
jgi:hypothetical protein